MHTTTFEVTINCIKKLAWYIAATFCKFQVSLASLKFINLKDTLKSCLENKKKSCLVPHSHKVYITCPQRNYRKIQILGGKWILLTGCWKCEDLPLEWEDSDIWARPARARAWALSNACIRWSHSAVLFRSIWPLTSAWSLTKPLNARKALLAFKMSMGDRVTNQTHNHNATKQME